MQDRYTVTAGPGAPADSKPLLQIEAAERDQQARVRQDPRPIGEVEHDGASVPLMDGNFQTVVGLDEPREGVHQVVSVITAMQAEADGRTLEDLVVPGDQMRDAKGRVIGCRGMMAAAEAWPRAGHRPQVAIFGSVARSGGNLGSDIDVAYQGLDPQDAFRIVATWAVRERPVTWLRAVDMHCLPATGVNRKTIDMGVLEIPRPARLDGEDGSVPVDEGVIVLHGDRRVGYRDVRSVASILRRVEALIASRVDIEHAATMATKTIWQGGGEVVFHEEPGPYYSHYEVGCLGPIRRSLARLERTIKGQDTLDAMRRAGFPLGSLRHILEGRPIHAAAKAKIDMGSPGGAGGLKSIRFQQGSVGPVHGGPWFTSDADLLHWLRTGEVAKGQTPESIPSSVEAQARENAVKPAS